MNALTNRTGLLSTRVKFRPGRCGFGLNERRVDG